MQVRDSSHSTQIQRRSCFATYLIIFNFTASLLSRCHVSVALLPFVYCWLFFVTLLLVSISIVFSKILRGMNVLVVCFN